MKMLEMIKNEIVNASLTVILSTQNLLGAAI